MSAREFEASEESKSNKQDLIDLLRDLSDHGVDYQEEDLPHLQAMEEDELMSTLIISLESAGVQNPLEYIESHNLIERFRALTPEEFQARNAPSRQGKEYSADQLDAQEEQLE